ncbi:hypothetical protein [Chitinimonas sp.]|uniref:hypothetical protein n=1 Tax=Chitinimonas sp. TaxID=1934313 RepID=UPI002F948C8B
MRSPPGLAETELAGMVMEDNPMWAPGRFATVAVTLAPGKLLDQAHYETEASYTVRWLGAPARLDAGQLAAIEADAARNGKQAELAALMKLQADYEAWLAQRTEGMQTGETRRFKDRLVLVRRNGAWLIDHWETTPAMPQLPSR